MAKKGFLNTLRAKDTKLLEDSFSYFLSEAWKIIHPQVPFVSGWYHELLAEWLMLVRRGACRHLIVNLPPRSGKSSIVSTIFPVWWWVSEPSLRAIFYSYRESLAIDFSTDRRTLIQSKWFQDRWGERFHLSDDQCTKSHIENNKRGSFEVVSTSTGTGGALCIIDDPQSADMAYSEAEREAANRLVTQTLTTRLDDQRTGRTILVQQRIHENDCTGVLSATGDYTVLSLPAEITDKPQTLTYPISGRVRLREKGDLLDPIRLPKPELIRLSKAMGPWAFSAQYLMNPEPPGGGVVHKDWWKWYEEDQAANIRASADFAIICCDPALKAKEENCDSAMHVYASVSPGKSYLLDRVTGKYNFAGIIGVIETLAQKWQTRRLLCEDTALGPAIISQLRDKGFEVVPYQPLKDKMARLSAASITVQSGLVYLPRTTDGVRIQELAAKAPNCPMDDNDVLSMYLGWHHDHGDWGGWLKAEAERIERGAGGEPSTDANAYATTLQPTLKQLYDQVRESMDQKICHQPADGRLPVPKKPGVTCPSCSSTRVLLAGISGKCRDCKTIFTPGLRRN
jgi:predicted phage terminase large subunit-like protein